MSHLRVKTTYSAEGTYASTEKKKLYCHHFGGSDSIIFYNEDGNVTSMVFESWESGNDLWDAMMRLYEPFKGEWFGELKAGVEYYYEIGD